ncbi:hypothetical protein [Acidovorax sp. SUPP2825]|uniref:hypothetical protein n=1 Tax=Acidovorax sp. SUPP2825 TaxID=2920879 RepID=UPI0023DE5422|nr:hypothetical protein [Acidovorax sp. SUPP2825]GKS96778.1 hypothetical protein AVAK2825_19605 [Acidovorax sp. SUPP2825]
MSAAAPNPGSNLLLLAVIGIGAYYFMSRRAVAQPVYANQQAANAANNAARLNLINTGVSTIGKIFSGLSGGNSGGSIPLLGTYDGRSQTPWDVTPEGPSGPQYNNPSAYVAPSARDDGIAANTPYGDPWAYFG